MRHARSVFLAGALTLAVVSVASSTNHETPAETTPLNQATAAAPIPASQGGGFYIADTNNDLVRRVDPEGNIATVAGNGEPGAAGDGGPALQAQVGAPTDAVPTPDGGILIASPGITGGEDRVRKVSAEGIISTVAGADEDTCPQPDDDTDGCPATQVVLSSPTSAVPRDGGSFLIAEYLGEVREVGADGTIRRVAGGGAVCAGAENNYGDGCQAREAVLEGPTSAIPFDIAGAGVNTPGTGFLIGERNGCRVRYVKANGVIDTVAGLTTPSVEDNCRDQSDPAPPTTGTATSLRLASATDARPTAEPGVFLVTNSLHCTVYKVDMTADTYQTLHQDVDCANTSGNYGLTAAIPAPGGRFLIADANSGQVARAEPNGEATNVAGSEGPKRNTSPPVITGTPQEGQTLACSNGEWNHSPTSFAHQWNQNGVAISGATAPTYTVPGGVVGRSLSCTVTAENSANPPVVESATSDAVVVQTGGGPPPDRDGDGIPDASDVCPDQDARGQDANGDGCIDQAPPAADGDSDGVPDANDRCPAENASARDADRNGCLDPLPGPGPGPGPVTLPDTTKPLGTLSGVPKKVTLRKALKDGFAVKVAPNENVTALLEVVVSKAQAKKVGLAATKIAKGTKAVSANSTVKVAAKLTKKAKKRLRKVKPKSLKLTYRVKLTDTAGNSTALQELKGKLAK